MPTKGNIMANANARNVRVAGQGDLWIAPVGSTLPTDSTTNYGAAFTKFGFATDGFTLPQDLKTSLVNAWQTLEPVLLINQSRSNQVTFEAIESNKTVLGLAFGGGSVVTGAPTFVGGAVTFTSSTITTATAHGLAINQAVVFGTITGTPGVLAGVVYYVLTVPTATTVTVAATLGGSVIAITTGSSVGVGAAGPYSITIPDSAIATEYTLGIDWQHGANTARFGIPRFALASLPTLKYGNDDAVRYPLTLQILKPFDGSQSFIPLGNDVAALS